VVIDEDFAPVTKFLRNRWFVDAVFEEHLMQGVVFRTAEGTAFAESLLTEGTGAGAGWTTRLVSSWSSWADNSIVDAGVRSISNFVRLLSWPFRALQSGFVQTYALLVIAGVLVALGFYLER
jgi:hypothetical protein